MDNQCSMLKALRDLIISIEYIFKYSFDFESLMIKKVSTISFNYKECNKNIDLSTF